MIEYFLPYILELKGYVLITPEKGRRLELNQVEIVQLALMEEICIGKVSIEDAYEEET